jgi:hypothetical protein
VSHRLKINRLSIKTFSASNQAYKTTNPLKGFKEKNINEYDNELYNFNYIGGLFQQTKKTIT